MHNDHDACQFLKTIVESWVWIRQRNEEVSGKCGKLLGPTTIEPLERLLIKRINPLIRSLLQKCAVVSAVITQNIQRITDIPLSVIGNVPELPIQIRRFDQDGKISVVVVCC